MLKASNKDARRTLSQQELNGILLAHERLLTYQKGAAKAELAHARLDGLNLANRNLAEADLSFASMVGATAFGTNLERAILHCSDMRDSDFSSARLMRAEMRGASICGARLSYAKLDGADLRAVTVAYRGPGAVSNEERTHSVDFSNASLKGVSFGHAKLEGCNFDGALLQGANFKNAQLANVTFRNAVLTGANLSGHSIPPDALEGCVMGVSEEAAERAEHLKAKLAGHCAFVTSGATKGAPTALDGEDLRPLAEVFAGSPLTGLVLRRAIAIGIDFSGCQLQGARLDGADLRECDFSDADLRGASFRGAKLAHAKFEKANLGSLKLPNGASLAPDFTGAEADREQFRYAILEGSPAAIGIPAKIAA